MLPKALVKHSGNTIFSVQVTEWPPAPTPEVWGYYRSFLWGSPVSWHFVSSTCTQFCYCCRIFISCFVFIANLVKSALQPSVGAASLEPETLKNWIKKTKKKQAGSVMGTALSPLVGKRGILEKLVERRMLHKLLSTTNNSA